MALDPCPMCGKPGPWERIEFDRGCCAHTAGWTGVIQLQGPVFKAAPAIFVAALDSELDHLKAEAFREYEKRTGTAPRRTR